MYLKYMFDKVLAVLGIVVLSPVMVIIFVIVRISLGSPVIFKQRRPGMNGTPFVTYKFRTMTDLRDAAGDLLPDSERLTSVGRLLRRTSIDELPELFNVAKGDMSLVGPRPLLMRYTPFFTERERLRFTIRPGITGWAQINGRNHSSWDSRLCDDVWYVENRTFWIDITILFRTILQVFRGQGVVEDARSIMLNLDEERSRKKERLI